MRSIALAIVIGLAIGAALLGPLSTGPSEVSSGDMIEQPDPHTQVPARSIPISSTENIAASHGDSNSQSDEIHLNQNIIDGRSTTICTRDAALDSIMSQSVTRWNNALFGGLGFKVFEIAPNCSNVNVEVVQDQDNIVSCPNDFNDATGTGWWACYLYKSTEDPPRIQFRTSRPAETSGLRDSAVVVYQALGATQYQATDPIHIGLMMHELGHALGLNHYESTSTVDRCDALHDTKTDPSQDDYTVMTGPRVDWPRVDCFSGAIITGRDLRDFYEAYHVGAITNVKVDGDVLRIKKQNAQTQEMFRVWTIAFRWDEAGIAEANHNASRIAVLAKSKQNSAWRLVAHMAIRDSNGMAHRYINIEDTNNKIAHMYKIVGVTRGDPRLFGSSFDPTVPLRRPNAAAAQTYVEGDPTFVVGIERYDDDGTGVGAPEVLSASISPRHCFTNQTLTMHRYASGGLDGGSGATNTTISCGKQAGVKKFTAQEQWGDDVTAVRRKIKLPVMVRKKIPAVTATLSNAPASCAPGSSFDLDWSASGGDTGLKVWLNDTLIPSSGTSPSGERSISCLSPLPTRVRIVALVSDGSGGHAQVTVAAAAAAPTGVRADVNGADVTLSWAPVTGATEYEARACSGCTAYSASNPSANDPRRLSYVFSGLTRGRTYTLSVRARNANDANSVWSAWSSASAVLPLAAPTDLKVVNVTSDSATLSWQSVSGADDYIAKACAGSTCYSDSVSGTSATLTGLTPSTAYRFTVVARNSVGLSAAATATKTTLARATAPAAPTGVSVGSVTQTSATLSWQSVSGANAYIVRACAGSDCTDREEVNPQTDSLTGNRTPLATQRHTFTGLTPGTSYRFTVIAKNSVGSSAAAEITKATLARATAPAAPSGLTVSNITQTSATLSWNSVSGATSYRACAGSTCTNVSVTSATFTGLRAGTTYRFTVVARNGGGSSPAAAKSVWTIPATPTGLTVSSITQTSATLSWQSVSGATGYRACAGSICTSVSVLSGTIRSATLTGLRPGTLYTFTVVARNSSGSSAAATESARTIPATPTGLTVSSITQTSATLSWNWVNGATGYTTCAGSICTNVSVLSGTIRSATLTGLRAGTTYRFTVVARNSSGSSAAAEITKATLARATAPAAPSGLTVSNITQTSATLSWNSVSGATSYRACAGSTCTNVSVTSATLTGLRAGTTYRFTVVARNSSGSSAAATATKTTLAAATSFTVTGKISARLVSSGNIEVAFSVGGGSRILPTPGRYLNPTTYTTGKWYQSSAVSDIVGGVARTLGQVSARFVGSGTSRYAEICFVPHYNTRACPSGNNFYYRRSSVTTNKWYWTDSRSYTVWTGPRPEGASAEDSGMMEAAAPGAADPVGSDGGAMADLITPPAPDADTEGESDGDSSGESDGDSSSESDGDSSSESGGDSSGGSDDDSSGGSGGEGE